jgi:hypothetical protein
VEPARAAAALHWPPGAGQGAQPDTRPRPVPGRETTTTARGQGTVPRTAPRPETPVKTAGSREPGTAPSTAPRPGMTINTRSGHASQDPAATLAMIIEPGPRTRHTRLHAPKRRSPPGVGTPASTPQPMPAHDHRTGTGNRTTAGRRARSNDHHHQSRPRAAPAPRGSPAEDRQLCHPWLLRAQRRPAARAAGHIQRARERGAVGSAARRSAGRFVAASPTALETGAGRTCNSPQGARHVPKIGNRPPHHARLHVTKQRSTSVVATRTSAPRHTRLPVPK